MKSSEGNKIKGMVAELEAIIALCLQYEKKFQDQLDKVHPNHAYSASNLVHYLALRSRNLKKVQKFLYKNGYRGFKNAESHVMASLLVSKKQLKDLLGEKEDQLQLPFLSISESNKILRKNIKALFGKKSKGRSARIMVTQPVSVSKDPDLILEMMSAGMDSLRINCAQDSAKEWLAIIRNAKSAMANLKKQTKIAMDLGGPKIRGGVIKPGPEVAILLPEHDDLGRVINPAYATMVPQENYFPEEKEVFIPVPPELIDNLDKGDILSLKDTRHKQREFKVIEKKEKKVRVSCFHTTYLKTGIRLQKGKDSFPIGEIAPIEQFLYLKKDDRLVIHKNTAPGEPALLNQQGKLMQWAHISCTSEEVFYKVKPGEKVVFDDGKINGEIIENNGKELLVKIGQTKKEVTKLKANKGINFPESDLKMSGLTEKDREDLKFVVDHADFVNISFVDTPANVEELLTEINSLNALNKIGIILKIETMTGFRNLVHILLAAMRVKPIGVMIARGDLAIESGWEHIGPIQEEILKICAAAHIPTIWATQVMENLAKKGIPSRAEITDAVMAQRADCIMLNKGPYIIEAIRLLNTILKNLEKVRRDKRTYFKQMKKA